MLTIGTSSPEVLNKAGQLGLIAAAASTSESPKLHNRALRWLAHSHPELQHWQYQAYMVAPAQLAETLAFFHEKGLLGLNVSHPHKMAVMPLLAGCDEAARRIGACNTLTWTPKGYWGTNTDGLGLKKALRCCFGIEPKGQSLLLIGAGGAARAAAFMALEQGCRHLWLFNRTQSHALNLQRDLLKRFPSAAVDLWTDPNGITGIIFAAAAPPQAPLPIELKDFALRPWVYDMRYGPMPSSLLLAAKRLGLPHADGRPMLRAQGMAALRVWLNKGLRGACAP